MKVHSSKEVSKESFFNADHFLPSQLRKEDVKEYFIWPNGCIAFNFSPGGIGAIIEISRRNR
ncbi:hypothetical protein M9R32_00220 [Paenisporosarcina quisquiliarum]|uniref:Uncharacterized protein n=1 Tax=Paenisporosarcina quisquiliarum TaxID=365346 RepID=A0A9X3RCT1_9BACL|nr:hypothetical protein [Paenisporosarcina quisquiliarum]MCZ8535607.1 hypothetical protein [Paenisporosarcina quisquiliarum]